MAGLRRNARWALVTAAAAWLAACGQPAATTSGDDATAVPDSGNVSFGQDSKSGKDVGDTSPTTDVFLTIDIHDVVADAQTAGDDAISDALTDANTDATGGSDAKDAALMCPGASGCPCTSNNDCDNQACIATAAGSVCAIPCGGECPVGFQCGPLSGGSDPVQFCLPKFTKLCDPCLVSADCQALGATLPRCVDRGAEGRFCGTGCVADSDCAGGYLCQQVETAEGDKVKQCVLPVGLACGCSPGAEGKSTPCQASVVLGDGKQVTCGGNRACVGGVLEACTADPPGGEVCDGKDNDCNGLTDDSVAACEDNNPCTVDGCGATAVGVPSACTHTALPDGVACDDNKCMVGRVCLSGSCAAGAPKVCADANAPCLVGLCDSKTGCAQVNADGEVCSDGNPCTKGDQCASGDCAAGTPKNCDDQDPCTIDKCDKATGACAYLAVLDGTPCDDNNICTAAETCTVVGCAGGKPKDCGDGNPCTVDTCSPTIGCAYTNTSGPCDDGDACTTGDACGGGTCAGVPLSGNPCEDDNPCTADSCSAKTGCSHKPQTGTCDDGNACTANDFCQLGVCQSGSSVCTCAPGDQASCQPYEDGNACNGTLACVADKGGVWTCQLSAATVVTCDGSADTACSVNSCNPQSGKCGYVSVIDGTPCNSDSNACTLGDACGGGTCLPGAATPECGDGNPCTTDLCLPASGCMNSNNAALCDDGNACTTSDTCALGGCVGGAAANCDDGNACTLDDCNAKTGCGHSSAAVGDACEDGNPCTTIDSCVGTTCVGSGSLPCSDSDACTADICVVGLGCAHTPTTGTCNDGDACTTGETCAGGTCGGGSNVACDDGTVCTTDDCDTASGCVFTWTSGTCDDGDACTQNDACAKGACTGGTTPCNDGNVCTTDSCDSGGGCTHSNNSAACDDLDPCTTVDVCSGGACQGSIGKDCADTNPCTDDSCQTGYGCLHSNNSAVCVDNDPCTTVDLCASGACGGSGALDCNDGNACTTDACAKGYGCVHGAQAGTCSDGNPCTTTDTCSATVCVGSGSLTCNDNQLCTTDSCQTGTGCVYAPNSLSCDDNDACTLVDKCSGGSCVGVSYKDCSDGKPCTKDVCTNGVCSNPNYTYAYCYTGDPCTIDDYCSGGVCLKGPPDPCDDYNECTTDSCTAGVGCKHVANTAVCDDGDPCTVNDTCANKTCKAGTEKDCTAQDGPCTTGYCDYYGVCKQQNKYFTACTLGTSAGTCDYYGNCQPTYSVDGCTGSKFVASCITGNCDACISECLECASPGVFHAVNETGCGGASCFSSYPTTASSHGLNNDTGVVTGMQAMKTSASQTAYAEWLFPNALLGDYQLRVWIPDPKYDGAAIPAGCAKWNYATNAIYRIYKGATLWKSVTVDQSWSTYYGYYTTLYSGDCTGVTKVVVTNAASPTTCGFVLLDELKALPY